MQIILIPDLAWRYHPNLTKENVKGLLKYSKCPYNIKAAPYFKPLKYL